MNAPTPSLKSSTAAEASGTISHLFAGDRVTWCSWQNGEKV